MDQLQKYGATVRERLGKIIKAYDVRGVVPDDFDAAIAERIGAAFGALIRSEAAPDEALKVLVGRDMRPTGPELVAAFVRGVNGQGIDVIDLGLISTDMLFYACGRLDAAGVVFTASHNPAQYNGIKMCRAGAVPVGQDTGLTAIRDMAADGVEPVGTGTVTTMEILDDFATHVLSFIDAAELRPLKVVADTANGMGGLVVPAVFAHLPVELDILYPELDGNFPNHPADPLNPENLVDLQARVLELEADIGLAFDGDADRVFIVDEKAQPVSGSVTTAMVSSLMLERDPGGTVLHNLICSKAVPEVVAEAGGTAERTRVGHSFIKQRMAETGAVFAGEHSGHYYFRDNYRADSGLIAAMAVLTMLSRHNGPLSDLLKPFDRYAASGEINTTVSDPNAVIQAVKVHFSAADQDELDGLTVDFGDWWFNLRASNTEPLLRLNLEAGSADEVATRVAEVQAVMASV